MKKFLILFFFSLTSIQLYGAIIYDAVDDFSGTINDNSSTWSYRYANDEVRDGNYNLLTTYNHAPGFTPNTDTWKIGPSVPAIGVNHTGSNINHSAGGIDWQDDTIWIHPGVGGMTVVSWLSSEDGVADISFTFSDTDPNGGNGALWFVDLGDLSSELASGYIHNNSTGLVELNNVNVSAGQRINFGIAANGDYTYDSTGFTANVSFTAVPEPTTSSFITLGLLALGAFKRKRITIDSK